MGVFDGEQQDALELIAEFGEDAQLKVLTTTVPDPDQPWEHGPPTPQTLIARMVFLNFSDQSNSGSAGERYFNGTLIQTGDKKVLVAAKGLAFAPNLHGQIIRADSSLWKIENMKDLDPNGQKLLYILLARQ